MLVDRDTAALYVRVNDQLHPVLNLTSARLAAGKPVNPTLVRSAELNKFPRGVMVGIPGAPERMVQVTSRDADWTVCDGTGAVALESPSSPAHPHRAVSAPPNWPPTPRSWWITARAPALWDGRRSLIDLNDRRRDRAAPARRPSA